AGTITIPPTTPFPLMHATMVSPNSGDTTFPYTTLFRSADPVLNPASGTYISPVTLTITDSTAGASIYYTTDGSAPTTSSTRYAGSISLTQATTVSAMAAATGMTNSGVVSASYNISKQTV